MQYRKKNIAHLRMNHLLVVIHLDDDDCDVPFTLSADVYVVAIDKEGPGKASNVCLLKKKKCF